jgi:hypothetical protein
MRLGNQLVETLDFHEGRTITHKIRQLNILAGLLLRFTGTWTVTGGNGAGTILSDAVWRAFLRRYAVNWNNADMQRAYGPTLRVLEKLFHPAPMIQDGPTALAAATAEGIELNAFIPFYMFHSHRPDEFAFATADVSVRSPVLQIECGRASEAATGETGVLSIANGRIEVYEIPMLGTPTAGDAYSPLLITQIEYAVNANAASARIPFDQMLPGMEIRAVIIESHAKGAGDEYVHNSDVLTYAALNINGTDVFHRTAATVIRNRNVMFYQLNALETGVAVLDAAEDMNTGRGELWTVRGQLRPYLEVDLQKQAGENRLLITIIATNGRIAA